MIFCLTYFSSGQKFRVERPSHEDHGHRQGQVGAQGRAEEEGRLRPQEGGEDHPRAEEEDQPEVSGPLRVLIRIRGNRFEHHRRNEEGSEALQEV